MFSRSASTQAAYEVRIDALFAKDVANRVGVRVLDRSDVLDMLGFGDKPVLLQESKVLAGQVKHRNMTASMWKMVPQWLENPAAVFDSDTEPGSLVFVAPEAVAGSPAVMIVKPNPTAGGAALSVSLLVNAYDKEGGMPASRWMRDGLLRYADKKTFPAIFTLSVGRQLPDTALQNKPGTRSILTEKNLAAYRRANSPAFSVAGVAPISERLDTPTHTKIANAVNAGWAQAADVVVVETMQDARVPQAARDEDAKQRAMGAAPARGFYHDGKVYLVAEGLASERDVVETMLHESLGHHGLRGVFGSDLDGILDQIITVRLAQVRAKAEAAGIDWKKEGRPALRNAAEEILADMAQNTPELGFVRRTIAAIRTWARKNVPGFRGMAVTDAEIIRAYILPARGWVQRGAQASSGAGPAMFSRGGFDATSENDAALKAVEQACGCKPAWEKGKAEGKTKLTYGQWLQVRTPKFKAWFGDWEAAGFRSGILATPAVQAKTAGLSADKSGPYKALRQESVATYAGPSVVQNEETGYSIRVEPSGIEGRYSTACDLKSGLLLSECSTSSLRAQRSSQKTQQIAARRGRC